MAKPRRSSQVNQPKWSSCGGIFPIFSPHLLLAVLFSSSACLVQFVSLAQEAGRAGPAPTPSSPGKQEPVAMAAAATTTTTQTPITMKLEDFLPKASSLFRKDAIDGAGLASMDCHLRNIDYCYAGLLSSSARPLPENNDELETRCDEIKATTSCLSVFNDRCQSFKLLSGLSLSPMGQYERLVERGAGDGDRNGDAQLPALLQSAAANLSSSAASPLSNLPAAPFRSLAENTTLPAPILESLLSPAASDGSRRRQALAQSRVSLMDLMRLCEPQARSDTAGTGQVNKLLREQLFQMARCVNKRVPHLRPCIDELKTAFQLFYEPRRSLPLGPTCCAMARFRACAVRALDNVCGLSSLDQLESMLASQTGGGGGAGQTGAAPTAMLASLNRVCRNSAANHESAYCAEVLPPAGMRAPNRLGGRASKLAKALDLISLAPATQME